MKYWHYTYQKTNGNTISFGRGTVYTQSEFNFAGYYEQHPDCILLCVNEISKKQYEALNA